MHHNSYTKPNTKHTRSSFILSNNKKLNLLNDLVYNNDDDAVKYLISLDKLNNIHYIYETLKYAAEHGNINIFNFYAPYLLNSPKKLLTELKNLSYVKIPKIHKPKSNSNIRFHMPLDPITINKIEISKLLNII